MQASRNYRVRCSAVKRSVGAMSEPVTPRFSRWLHWLERSNHPDISLPGVYVISRFLRAPPTRRFSFCSDIIYIGMSNSLGGVGSRLKQFDSTMSGKLAHGGADRVRYAFPSYGRLVPKLYVAVAPFPCDVTSIRPRDLCTMGDVARFEYVCLAAYAKRFGELPRFNNKRNSPKFSKHGIYPRVRANRSRVSYRGRSASK
jgi:hypothetical protein